MQEILPPLLRGGDLTAVQTIPNWDRVPWMEETRASLVMDKLPSPRAMVSHMPYQLMPSTFFTSKAKVQIFCYKWDLLFIKRHQSCRFIFECTAVKGICIYLIHLLGGNQLNWFS